MKFLRLFTKGIILMGGYKFFRGSYDLYQGINNHYLSTPTDLKQTYANGYVIITGSTDGLGKEYAIEIAKKGFDLILIGRNAEKLNKVKQQLSEVNQNIDIRTTIFDFAETDYNKYVNLGKQLSYFDISMVINCAAGFYGNKLGDLTNQQLKDQLYSNCYSKNYFLHQLLPHLQNQSHKSTIVNVGSQKANYMVDKSAAAYFATKAYTNNLTQSLIQENKSNPHSKVDIYLNLPGVLQTSMLESWAPGYAKSFKGGLLTEYPKYFVQKTLAQLGREVYDQSYIITGSERHSFLYYIFKNIDPVRQLVFGN